jgi:mannose-6-phosphate isomerase-like protein (cupin superfamily)
MPRFVFPAAEAAVAPNEPGRASARILAHGSFEARWYAPRGTDPQAPHTRDEAYVVVSGSGTFFRGGERAPFGPGDLIHVPAGVEHRFEDFTENLAVWVVFYGPEGGETRSPT